MEMSQEPAEFKPITITFETRSEVNTFWDLIRSSNCVAGSGTSDGMERLRDMRSRINSWLTNEAKI